MRTTTNRCDDAGSLRGRISRGLVWVTAATAVTRGAALVSAVLLAHWLTPTDFGNFAMAAAVHGALIAVVETGLQSALVQRPGATHEFLDAVWTFELTKNLLLFVLVWLLAPALAHLLRSPDLTDLLRITNVGFICYALRNIGTVYLRKELDFYRQFLLESVPVLISTAAALVLAYFWRTALALAVSFALGTLATLAASYVLHPYRPQFHMNLRRVAELLRFGRWVFLNSVVVMVRSHGLALLVGRLLGAEALGIYNRGLYFSKQPFEEVTKLFWKIGFPTFALVHQQPERFRRFFSDSVALMALLVVPAAAALLVLSPALVAELLGERWLPIIPVMQAGSAIACLSVILAPCFVAFQASGRPHLGSLIAVLDLVLMLSILVPLSRRYGSLGAPLALLLAVAAIAPFTVARAVRLTGVRLADLLQPLAVATFNSGVVAGVAYATDSLTWHWGPLRLVPMIATCAVVHLAMLVCWDRLLGLGIVAMLLRLAGSLRDPE